MKADEAMLLPTLHKELVNEAFAFMFPWLGDLSEQDLPTNHWLLSQLRQAQTQGSVQDKRYGSLMFHKSCDLVQAFSITLGKHENIQTSRQAT